MAQVLEEGGGARVRVVLAPRYCPFASPAHPDAGRMTERGGRWLNGFGLGLREPERSRMLNNDCGEFYGRIMPRAPAGRLQLAVDWCTLMVAFADAHCDEGAAGVRPGDFARLASRVLRVLEVPRAVMGPPGDVLLAAVRDLAERGRTWSTAAQWARVVEEHRGWFYGVLWEFACRAQDRTPALNDYAHMRQHTAAGPATLCWAEIVDGVEIPERDMASPAVRALRELAFTTAAFDDDLFSYGKERWLAARSAHATGCRLNLVDILAQERGLPVHKALEEAVALTNRLTARFARLREQVLPTASGPLRQHLDHLSTLLRGNAEWGLRAGRYSDPDGRHPGAVVTTGSFTDTAPPAGAPGIAALSWLWELPGYG